MNKVTIAVATVVFATASFAPESQAITETYRIKLLHSGCTQITESQGCNINKSKSWNAKHGFSEEIKDGQSEPPRNEAKAVTGSRVHAVKLIGRDFDEVKRQPFDILVNIGEGFTKAMINDKPAKITRKQPDFYEIKGNGYIISVAMNGMGVESAAWNHYKGRDHGMLNIIKN